MREVFDAVIGMLIAIISIFIVCGLGLGMMCLMKIGKQEDEYMEQDK